MRIPHFLILLFLISTSYATAQFEEISQSAGINHIHSSPTLMGGGVCMDDFNKDGWQDIAVTGGNGHDFVFINQRDKTYSKYTLPHNRYKIATTTAVISGDFNNDTCIDLIYTTLDKSEGLIYLQGNCDGTFMDVSPSNEIDDEGPSTGIVIVDINHDGLQDLYVLNYIEEQKFIRNEENQITGFEHQCGQNYLLINQGDFNFLNATDAFEAGGKGCALAATYVTVSDSVSGIYIANDFGEWIIPNEFLVYDTLTHSFKDRASEFGLDIPVYGMGIALGDYDNDLSEEIYVTNIGSNYLLKNQDGFFVDKSEQLGIQNQLIDDLQSTSWGTLFFDVENDGDLDLFVSNGEITSAPFLQIADKDPSTLFLNHNSLFEDASIAYGVGDDFRNRGVVSGDIDHDGDIDLLLTTISLNENTNESSLRYKLFENRSSTGNYLKIELKDQNQNCNPFGAIVRIYSDSLAIQRTTYSSGTFASQSSPIIHFGLGQRTNIDSLVVLWPSGSKDLYHDLRTNQFILLEQGKQEYDILGCMDDSDPHFDERATRPISCAETLSTSQVEFSHPEITFNTLVHKDLVIKFNNAQQNVLIYIFDIYGRPIKTEIAIDNQVRLNLSLEPTGTYFFRAIINESEAVTGIFVKI